MKKFLATIAILFLALNLVPSFVVAAPPNSVRNTVKTNAATAAAALKAGNVVKLSGTIASLGTNSFTLTTNEGSVTVNLMTNAVLLRRFGAKATFAEFSVSDRVQVLGKYNADKTAVDARVVRNQSIQKRHGTFVGTIISTSTNSFTFQPLARPIQTVTTIATTRFVDRTMKPITFSTLAVGHRVMVRGVWDNKLNTVTETVLVKDFTLPVISPNARSATASAITPTNATPPAALTMPQ